MKKKSSPPPLPQQEIGPSALPTNVHVSNLGESTFSEACDVLANIIKESSSGVNEKKRLREQVVQLKKKHEEEVRKLARFKKQYGRALVSEINRNFVNVKEGAPRTNAWNVGDYKTLREPQKKKKKTKKGKK